MLWITLRQLKSTSVPTRRRAAAALCTTPDAGAFEALAAARGDDDAEVRRLVATALGKLEDPRCVEALLGSLRDSDPEVQKAALVGLKQRNDERIAPTLVPLLNHADPNVRGHAASLLSHQGWQPAARTEEINYHVARGQLAKVAVHGAAAIQALEKVIQTGDYGQRVAAVEALGKINDQRVIKPLLAALQSADPSVCAAAISALGQTTDPQVFDRIAGMLRHADGQVRTVAVEALAQFGASRAVESLKPMLRDPVWDVRRATAAALGKLKDPRAVVALAAALQDEDADVREASVIALGNLNDRRAIGPLVNALADATTSVRRIAAASLSRIDEDWVASEEARAAVEGLKGALQDQDSDLRYSVGKLLSSLGVHAEETDLLSPGETLASSPEKRRKLAASLLLATLCDADHVLRQAAAESLGRLGEQRAAPALQRALRDTHAGVRLAAEQALLELQSVGETAPTPWLTT